MVKPNLSRRRALITCVLFALVATGACVGINLPMDFKQHYRTQVGSHPGPIDSSLYGERALLRRSGWPWNYRVQLVSESDPVRVTMLYQSAKSLVANAFVSLAIVLFVTAYTWKRYRSVASSDRPNRVRFRYDACSALACLAIPAGVYFYSNVTAQRHRAAAQELSRCGQCMLTAEMPDWLASIIPPAMHDAFLRLHSVEILSPTNSMLDLAMEQKTIRGLRILDTELEPGELERIEQLPELTEISLENCRFDCEGVRVLSNHNALRTLTLKFCSLGPAELEELNRLRNLERVDLSFASIKLSDFKQTGWAGSVRSLRLPSPPHDRTDRLTLRNWIALRDLGLHSLPARPAGATVELELAGCPSLKALYLPVTRSFSIQATELPALEDILEPFETFSSRSMDSAFSSLPRWKSVRLNRVSHLKRLACDADELVDLDLSAAKRLHEIVIGKSLYTPLHIPSRKANEYENSHEWIRAIARLPHVRTLAIDGVHLDEEHLSMLADLPALRNLTLTNVDLTNEMLDPIAELDSLHELNLQLCRINGQRLQQFLRFERLKKITVDLSGLKHLHVANLPRLQEISTAPLRHLSSLHLANLPNFTSPVVVQGSVGRLRVVNTPRLGELVLECPWPSDYQLRNVDSLVRFAAGGANVDDRLADHLFDCENLDQVILAYASLSRDMLGRLGEMANLTALEVPGADVDDEVTCNWFAMKRLRRICLDDTRVSDRTCAWMRSLESLRSLSLQGLQLNDDACQEIASLPLLSELSLARTPFPPSLLADLISLGGLEVLDISGHQMTDELLEAIRLSRMLRTVTLLGSKLSARQIERLISLNPSLLLIHDADSEILAMLSESSRGRVFTNIDHFAENYPFPHTHRVLIYTNHERQHGGGQMMIARPFAIDQFRSSELVANAVGPGSKSGRASGR